MNRIQVIFVFTVVLIFFSCQRETEQQNSTEQRIDQIDKSLNIPEEKTTEIVDLTDTIEPKKRNIEKIVVEEKTISKEETKKPAIKVITPVKKEAKPVLVSKKGKLKFENTKKEFGRITEGDKLNFEFTFTNTGDASVLIKNVLTDCGCTTVDFPKKDIAVGEKSTIKIDFDSAGKLGSQEKIITVLSNGEPRSNILRLIGVVGTD